MNDNSVIEVSDLARRFGDVVAVDSVAFDVRRGEPFGFLGPNGSGKTTTINMLTGLARPDAGTICISGINCSRNPKAAQHLMGVVPDESNLYPELTGFENLCFCGALYGMSKSDREARARELLDHFGLAEAAGRKFGGYSKGMKHKLTIDAGIIHQPRILFLDEPTTGIDVVGARQIRQLVADLNTGGTTIHVVHSSGKIKFVVILALLTKGVVHLNTSARMSHFCYKILSSKKLRPHRPTLIFLGKCSNIEQQNQSVSNEKTGIYHQCSFSVRITR